MSLHFKIIDVHVLYELFIYISQNPQPLKGLVVAKYGSYYAQVHEW